MDLVATIFLLFFVVLIGSVFLWSVLIGIIVLLNSSVSLLEYLHSFVHRNDREAPPSAPQILQAPVHYLP